VTLVVTALCSPSSPEPLQPPCLPAQQQTFKFFAAENE